MPDKWKDTRYRNLLEQIDICKPKYILEFGTWKAYTAVKMVKHANKYREGVHYFGIDLFENLTCEQAAYENMTKQHTHHRAIYDYLQAEIPGQHSVLIGYSHIVFPTLRENILKKKHRINTVDFIFIDGGHSLETINWDWMMAESVMGRDTVVIFDDYYEGIQDVGAKSIIDFTIDRDKFNVVLLDPVEQFIMKDGRSQPTQMVKVTRKQPKVPLQNHELDEQISRNPYLPETYAGPEVFQPVSE